MGTSRVDTFTRCFFWFGYGVFLLASIPHIAAYFRHFDPNTANWVEDYAYWGVAIFLAVVIDVSDVLVSIAVMKEMSRGTKHREMAGYWAFIVFIMALSWFFNWQYNLVFGTQTFAAADKVDIMGWFTVGQINPVIGSAFQLLLLIYTGMAHKFAHKPEVKTAAQLQEEADEMEAKAEQIKRIHMVKKNQQSEKIGGVFDTLRKGKEEATKTFFAPKDESDKLNIAIQFLTSNPQGTDEDLATLLKMKRPASARFWRLKAQMILERERAQKVEAIVEPTTDPLTPIVDVAGGSTDGTEMEEEVRVGIQQSGTNGMQKTDTVQSPSRKFSRRKPMTIAEVAAELECTERRVRELRSDGRLLTDEEDGKLITAASVRVYLNTHPKKQKSLESVTNNDAKNGHKGLGNGHHPDPLNGLVEMTV